MSNKATEGGGAAAVGFDLSTLDTVSGANTGVEVELFNPATTDNLGIFVTVLGRDSKTFQKLQAKQNRNRMVKMEKAGGFKIGRLSAEELETDAIELLAACTKSWRGVKVDGVDLDCNAENAGMLYARFPWIREQIDAAINDRANFTKA